MVLLYVPPPHAALFAACRARSGATSRRLQWRKALAAAAAAAPPFAGQDCHSYGRAGPGPCPFHGPCVVAAPPIIVHPRQASRSRRAVIRSLVGTAFNGGREHFRGEGQGLVLGIETSCDDTGAAVISADGRILGEAIASQADLLARWGGVVPRLAQEEHLKFIDKVVEDALRSAQVQDSDLSAVAVTVGPGLGPCLNVGVRKARNLARTHQLPWVGVHHMEAHALVVRLTEKTVEFPFIVLLVSGGHNLILLAQNVGEYIQLGTTMDEAIGEAYDKTARLLGLDLKRGGGPALEEIAHEGNPKSIPLSVPLRGSKYKDCNFSYTGLKTQVRLAVEARNIDGDRVPLSEASAEERQLRANIAASFQRVAVQHLEDKCRRGIEWARKLAPSLKNFVVSGGVASNQTVRGKLSALANEMGLQLVCPPPRLCTDNGVMVAWAGLEHLRLGIYEDPPPVDEPDDVYLDLRPRWQLGEILAEGFIEARSMKKPGEHQSLTAQVKAAKSRQEVNKLAV